VGNRRNEKIQKQNRYVQKNGAGQESVESALCEEESLWWEGFVQKVKPGVKERGDYGW